jgi:hypothetical protein
MAMVTSDITTKYHISCKALAEPLLNVSIHQRDHLRAIYGLLGLNEE